MRRSKADVIKTKEQIVDSASDMFLTKGYTSTSVDEIAENADVTKGAVYWHFGSKKDLFEFVLSRVLDQYGILNFAHELPEKMTYEQRMYEVFWNAQRDDSKVHYIYRAMNLVEYESELHEFRSLITEHKRKILDFFKDETRIHMRVCGIDGDSVPYARQLFLLYEGLFLVKNTDIADIDDRDEIESCVRMAIKDII